MTYTHERQLWDVCDNAWDEAFNNFTYSPINVSFASVTGEDEVLLGDTGEHVFQAMKTIDQNRRIAILHAPGPGVAKQMGRDRSRTVMREGWEGPLAVDVMEAIVWAKIDQHLWIRDILIATGTQDIIEVTYWNDLRWGTDPSGWGANLLGQVWMNVREALQ